MMRKTVIAVVGGSKCTEAERAAAYEVGRLLASAGAVVVCGGRGGVMEAVCQGASESGGTTIGILPGRDPDGANRFVEIAIPTGLGDARNSLVATSGEAMIAIGGSYGTLSEVAFALLHHRPVVGLGSWQAVSPSSGKPVPIAEAANPTEAVELAFGSIRGQDRDD